jgi:hypothetical protein
MGRIAGVLVLVLVLAFAGAYAASPLLAFQQLKQAAETGDRDRLEALVDFPAVREDLRAQTESKALKLGREVGGIGHPAAMLLGRAATQLSDQAVDKLVTPEAISELVRDGRSARDPAPADGGKGPRPKSSTTIRYAYLTPDRFKVTIAKSKSDVAAVALIMDRRGLFSWRVERIELKALADDDIVKDLY